LRTHGWSGSPPKTDEEAVNRILDAASVEIDRVGRELAIADVARQLGVTRQTVYRYFPSTEDLIVATAVRSAAPFVDVLGGHLRGIAEPAAIAVRAVVFVIEHLPENLYLDIALRPSPSVSRVVDVTSPLARTFSVELLRSLEVDWVAAGFDDAGLDELAEHMLRMVQTLVLDPGDPPRRGRDLEGYLDRWLRPAVEAMSAKARV